MPLIKLPIMIKHLEESPVYFVNSCGPRNVGGGETVLSMLSSEIMKRGHPVTWFYPDTADQRLDQCNCIPDGVHVKSFRMKKGRYLDRLPIPTDVAKLTWEISHSHNPRLIINGLFPHSLPFIAGIQFCKPNIKIAHIFHSIVSGKEETIRKGGLKRKLAEIKISLRRQLFYSVLSQPNVKNIAVSYHVAKTVCNQLNIHNSTVCYPPSIYDKCVPEQKGRPKPRYGVLSVSRISPEKGLDLVNKVARAAKELNLRFDFTLVGGGSSQLYEEQIKSTMIGYVNMPGIRTGPALCQSYTNADIGLFTSPAEGFGLVTTENLAHGNPVIATNISATSEVFSRCSGKVGLLISPTSHEQAVQDTMEFLAQYQSDENLRTELSNNALNSRRIFEPNILTNKFVDTILQN